MSDGIILTFYTMCVDKERLKSSFYKRNAARNYFILATGIRQDKSIKEVCSLVIRGLFKMTILFYYTGI